MKHLILSLLIFFSIHINAQEERCYCYENPAMNYTEWLYMIKDSVIVVGQFDKTCGEVDVDNWIDWARPRGYIWAFDEVDKEIKFSKVVVDPKGQVKSPMRYNYTCQHAEEGLQVHIEYKPAMRDMMGPPDRFYKKIELTE